ncbi:hypothetical protein [Roseimarinus sediminis]|uniref:hypothetical protein n=1 Tax=Roseimarinus sediminis TaxID=1610899 RepID=UPI003D19818D
MIKKNLLILAFAAMFLNFVSAASEKDPQQKSFNKEKDLLLVQLDCKTDVDDLHTAAALYTLMQNVQFSGVQYHVVAGTYGIQEGLYVPPNELLNLAWGDQWTNAHADFDAAVQKVKTMVATTLSGQGDIWIADAGQSDFTAAVVKAIADEYPELALKQRVHVVQHSTWNEEVTSPEKLQYVKDQADYQKIPDGNAVGNGTPGFRTPGYTQWKTQITDPKLLNIWQLAVELGLQYNAKEGRYNNEAVAAKGLDFSDLSEVCWIFGLEDIWDTAAFFKLYAD